MARDGYEIRVVGAIGPAAREAFRESAVEVEHSSTVLTAEVDQAGLHAMLDRVRALGLELVDVRRQSPAVPPDPSPPSARQDPATRKG